MHIHKCKIKRRYVRGVKGKESSTKPTYPLRMQFLNPRPAITNMTFFGSGVQGTEKETLPVFTYLLPTIITFSASFPYNSIILTI